MTDQAPELLPCVHPNLHFGSGDYHLFCHDCHQTWTVVEHAKANRGEATQLSGQLRTRPPSERSVAQMREAMWRDIAETLCAVDGNGFLHEASPTQQAAYEVRAKAVAALTAERPEAVRENLTAEEFAQILPRKDAP